MSLQDPTSDCLTRIRNGLMRGKKVVNAPFSKFKHELVSLLVKEGYIASCEKIKLEGKDSLSITLKYINEDPAIREIKRISKPGRRIYTRFESLPRVLNGLGIAIISTSKGILSDNEARDQKLGGEIICNIS
jgi:small subunit ribosomal protein S8